MGPALFPTNEVERLAALRRYAILDTLPEATFEGIADLAHQAFSAPIVLISFMDLTRQWFKARRGFEKEQIGRDLSFCAYAILARA